MNIINDKLVHDDKEYLVLSGNPVVLPANCFQSCEIANGRECFGVGNLVLEVYR